MACPDVPCLEARPISPADGADFLAMFDRMSPRTRYLRFAAPKPRLTSGELRFLTHVDHHRHEALLARDCVTLEPVAVARFVRLADRPDTAEVAVAVIDDFQGHGIGPCLLAELQRRATVEGVQRLRAEVLSENHRARRALARLGFESVGPRDGFAAYERAVAGD